MKKKRIVIAVVVFVILLLIIAAVMNRNGKGNAEAAETKTFEASKMTIEKTLTSSGEITSTLEENIEPHTSYYLKKIKIEEGDALEEGDTILTYSNGTKMTAPYNCVIVSWCLPDEGEQLTTDHYITLAGTDVLQIELSIDEDEVAYLNKGATAEITVEAVEKKYSGEVSHISNVGEYSDGTSSFKAKVAFDNDGKLLLGMNGAVTISLEKADNVIGVPTQAVHTRDNKKYVTVQGDNGSEEVEVYTGVNNDSYTEITSGLSVGDAVVVPESQDNNTHNMGGQQMPGGGMGNGSRGGSYPDKGNKQY